MIFAIVNVLSHNIVAKFDAKDSMDANEQYSKAMGFDSAREFCTEQPLVALQLTAVVLQ